MAALMKSTNDILFWDVNFFRGVHAQELEAMSGFMNTIYGSSIRGLVRIRCVGNLAEIWGLRLMIITEF